MIDSICTTVATVFANGPTVNPEHQEPKRPWVGLTDEEIEQTVGFKKDSTASLVYFSIARAIEAKLKEKNT